MEEYENYDYLQDMQVSEPETAYAINNDLNLARRIVDETGYNLFLTGKAGTGKTTFLRRLRETSQKRMIVLAPTGVAAINAEGVTIHSFFQLDFSLYLPGKGHTDSSTKHFNFGKEKRRIIATLDLIVIDEISMVRPDVLDAMDATLRRLRGSSAPFGGVQLLLIGDLRQLAPVVKDYEWKEMQKYYASPYFFESQALKKARFATIELKTIFRQTDKKFIDILNCVRDGNMTDDIINQLNSRYVPYFRAPEGEQYIYLTTHNDIANNYNRSCLAQIPNPSFTFDAEISGKFPAYSYPADEHLELKVGAQVMFVKNDTGVNRKFYNGLIGTVINIGEETVTVLPGDGGAPIEIGRMEWENTQYFIDEKSGEISSEVTGVFSQVPLRLAWAITIHKSQGLTFDHAVIDAERAFSAGQTYVALSRCRTLEGLVLSSPIRRESVIVDQTVNEFVKEYEESKPSVETLSTLKGEYTRNLLAELFDFDSLRRAMDSFVQAMREFVVPVSDSAKQPLEDEYMHVMKDIVNVGNKFKTLYASSPIDPDRMDEKLIAKISGGCKYFIDHIARTLRYLNSIDITLDNQTYITRINNAADELQFQLALKYETFIELEDKTYSTAEYNRAKAKAILASGGSQSVKKASKGKKDKSAKTTTVGDAMFKKEKKPKGYSQHISLNMFKEGKSIENIAKERNLTPSTIASHLAEFVKKGELDISTLISTEHLDILREAFGNGNKYTEALDFIAERLPRHEISLYYSSLDR